MIVYMPSVRTASQPVRVPSTMATHNAIGIATYHGQPKEMPVIALGPNIASRYPAHPAIVIWARLTIPP